MRSHSVQWLCIILGIHKMLGCEQIHSHNYLFVNTQTAKENGIADQDWIWVESMHGKVRCLCRTTEATEPGTVWTWNAIGKAKGAWALSPRSDESKKGFLDSIM